MVRHTVCMALVATWLLAALHGVASAEDGVQWRVSHFDTLTNTQESTVYATEQEALAYKRTYEKVENLSKGGPAYINWKITKEPKGGKPDKDKAQVPKDGEKKGGDSLARLRSAKDAVALAIRSSPAELVHKELLLREAIDDYKQAVADTFRRIREFEKTLLGGTQEMQEARFREINALVDRYNRQVNEFQAVMGPAGGLGYKPLPRFEANSSPAPIETAPATPADSGSLAGQTWSVTEIKGYDHYNNRGERVAGRPLAVEFRDGGHAVGLYHSDKHEGTWSHSGDIVTIRLDSFGRPGYSSYREGFRIRARRNPDGSMQVLEWAQDVP